MVHRPFRSALRVSFLLVSLAACASGNHGSFVWVDDYAPAKAPPTGYLIGIGDLVGVNVFGASDMSTKERVRPDGKLALPLIGDVTAIDKTPGALAQEIESALRDRKLIVDPHVNISVDEMKPLSVSVLGKVSRPGAYVIEPGAGVAQAIASAGGLTEFAKKDQIYLTRTTTSDRVRFRFDALTAQAGVASRFKLKSGDVIVVY